MEPSFAYNANQWTLTYGENMLDIEIIKVSKIIKVNWYCFLKGTVYGATESKLVPMHCNAKIITFP